MIKRRLKAIGAMSAKQEAKFLSEAEKAAKKAAKKEKRKAKKKAVKRAIKEQSNNKQIVVVKPSPKYAARPKMSRPSTGPGGGVRNDFTRSALEQYIACMLDPENYTSRIPDSYVKLTGLFRSKQTIPVFSQNAVTGTTPGTTWLAGDTGKFFALAKPTFGNFIPYTSSKVLLADGRLPSWQNGGTWTSQTAYVEKIGTTNVIVEGGGSDIRLDKYLIQMIAPSVFFYGVASGGSVSINNIFGTAPVVHPSSYGIAPIINPPINGVPLLNAIKLPPGNYNFAITVTGTGLGLGTFVLTFRDPTNSFDASNQQQINYSSTVGGTIVQFNINVVFPDSTIVLVNTTGSTSITGMNWVITPQFNDTQSMTESAGGIESVRPVACCFMFTPSTKVVNAVGNLAACRLPKRECMSVVFQDVAGQTGKGQCQEWSDLSDFSGAASTKFEEGIRVVYTPEDDSDRDMLSPDEMNTHEYPCLAIAGQFNPTTTNIVPNQEIGKLSVTTVYEYTTPFTLYELKKCLGNQMLIDTAMQMMGQYPAVTGNPTHFAWLTAALNKAKNEAFKLGKWAFDNKDILIPAGKAIMTAIA